jgi:peptidoglycan/LPS O-acetylase OafA/YrhL
MITISLKNYKTPDLKRIDVIDEIKGLAIILVVISHVCNIAGIPNFLRGELGVDIFLIMSGFLLVRSSKNLPLKDFIRNKFFRIFPPYWTALVLFIALNGLFLDKTFSIKNILIHTLGIQGIFSPHFFFDINQSFWFIPLIIFSYALFLIVRKKIHDTSFLIFVCGLSTALLTIFFFYTNNVDALNTIPARLISLFLGIILGQIYQDGQLSFNINLLLGTGALFFYIKFLTGTGFAYTIAALCIIFFWLALRKLLSRIHIGRQLLLTISSLGLISYEIFLFHQPFVQEFNLYALTTWFHVKIPSTEQIVLGALVGLCLTVLLSVLTHKMASSALKKTTKFNTGLRAIL